MKVKFSAVILLLHFGLLQASDSKFAVIPPQDKDIEIANYLKKLQETKEIKEREQENQEESVKLTVQRKYIQKMIDYRDVLSESAQELNDPNITQSGLLKINNRLLVELTTLRIMTDNNGGRLPVKSWLHGDKEEDRYWRGKTSPYSYQVYIIKRNRNGLFSEQESYNGCIDGCKKTFYCCGLGIIPVLLSLPCFYHCPSQNEIQAQAISLKSFINSELLDYQIEIEGFNKKSPHLMPNNYLNEFTDQIAIAPIIGAPQAVVAMEVEKN